MTKRRLLKRFSDLITRKHDGEKENRAFESEAIEEKESFRWLEGYRETIQVAREHL
jgi:hypothetical protein